MTSQKLHDLEAVLYSRSLHKYMRAAWHLIEPSRPFVDNWHIGAICEHLEAVTRGEIKRLVINVPPGSSKPVDEHARVWLRRGECILADVRVGDEILTHAGRYRRVSAVHEQGDLPVLRLETAAGRVVWAAPDHAFLTPEGWIQAKDLKAGDTLAAVVPQETTGSSGPTPELARFLGYLVGDGCTKYGFTIFTNNDPEVLADFEECAHSLGFVTRRSQKAGCTETYAIAVSANRTGTVQALRKEYGLDGKSSYTKRIPKQIRDASPEILENFLGAYWACDGTMAVRHTGTEGRKTSHSASLTTVSWMLAYDTQMAMQRLSIDVRVRVRYANLVSKRQPGGRYRSYAVTATNQHHVVQISRMRGLCAAKRDRIGSSLREFPTTLVPDELVSIREDGEARCRCLTVEDDHSFVVEGLAVHNSILTGVMWPSWSWTHSPHLKWITSSYAENVARRDAMRAQVIMQSSWYQARWGHVWSPHQQDWTTMRYSTDKGGLRLALTVGGSVTGDHADHQLVDDPIKPLEASGAALDTVALQKVILWWHESMATRMTDPAHSTRTIIMQRLHDRDLSGEVLAGGDYTHLCLPMRYDRKCVVSMPHPCSMPEPETPTPIGYKDERTEPGQLLWPERFPEELQAMRLKEMGSRAVAAQDQQRPVPAGGGILKPHWFRTWHTWPKQGSTLIQSWDLAFKGASHNDDVVGQVWARHGGEFYLLDQVSGKMSFSETCRAIVALSSKWPKALRILIEDAANGPAVMDALSKTVPGITPVKPIGGKAARAHAIEAIVESGNVFIPSPDVAPWVPAFLAQIESFSGQEGGRDDMVDTLTQALNYLAVRSTAHYARAMTAMAGDPSALFRR